MKLSQYLASNAISQKQFADKMGVCQATVHKWLYKSAVPSGKRIMQIQVITDGDVTVHDWIELHDIDYGDTDGQSAA